MAKFYERLTDEQESFIRRQHVFFVASAPLDGSGHVNLSPKGLDAFRVLSPTRVAYADLTSSGNETSAHLLQNGRITFMFCAFDGPPSILRLYGRGRTVLPDEVEWEDLSHRFSTYPSTRQLIVAEIHKVQTSCGFGVPLYEYRGDRDHHFKWAERVGVEGLEGYRQEHNLSSLDGLPTPLGKRARRRD